MIVLTEAMLEGQTFRVEVDSAKIQELLAAARLEAASRAPSVRSAAAGPGDMRAMLNVAFSQAASGIADRENPHFMKLLYNLADLVGGGGLLPGAQFIRLEPLEPPITEARLLEALAENCGE